MAKRFTRNIRSIKDIEKQPKNTNQQNDLLSDDKHVYIRNKDQYENLTNSVKSVNQKTIDKKGNVEVDTGVMQVNGKYPDNKGNVDIDAGSGIKTVTNVAPDENGNVDLQIKDFKEQKKLVRKNQLEEALQGIESGYKNYTDNAIEDKADKSEITELNNKIGNYYDNLFETKVLYDGMEDNSGLYFDESHSFSIDQNKKVEKVVFWWSRYDIGNGPKNYAFNNTIVDGEMLRVLQKKESTMRLPFKPTEADTTSFKNIDFTKEGVNGSEKNTQSNVGDRDNRWMALRKLYVVYRKEV